MTSFKLQSFNFQASNSKFQSIEASGLVVIINGERSLPNNDIIVVHATRGANVACADVLMFWWPNYKFSTFKLQITSFKFQVSNFDFKFQGCVVCDNLCTPLQVWKPQVGRTPLQVFQLQMIIFGQEHVLQERDGSTLQLEYDSCVHPTCLEWKDLPRARVRHMEPLQPSRLYEHLRFCIECVLLQWPTQGRPPTVAQRCEYWPEMTKFEKLKT